MGCDQMSKKVLRDDTRSWKLFPIKCRQFIQSFFFKFKWLQNQKNSWINEMNTRWADSHVNVMSTKT